MFNPILKKKQSENNDRFIHVWDNIELFCDKPHIDNLVDETIEKAKAVLHNKRTGFGWSGGKDSVALKFIMDRMDITDCVMGMTK